MTNEKIISDVLLFMDENKRTRADGRFLPMHGRQILRARIATPEEIRSALEYLRDAKLILCPNPMHGRQILRARIATPEEIRSALEYLRDAKLILCPNLEQHRTASIQINGITRDGYALIERLRHPIAEKVKGLIRRTLSNPSLLIELIHDLV